MKLFTLLSILILFFIAIIVLIVVVDITYIKEYETRQCTVVDVRYAPYSHNTLKCSDCFMADIPMLGSVIINETILLENSCRRGSCWRRK